MPFPKGPKGKGGGGGAATASTSEYACGLCSAPVEEDDAQGYISGTCSKCGTRRFHFDCVSEYLEKNARLMNSNSKAMEKGRNIARNRPQDLFAQNRTVQRKPQKCAIDASCTGLMVEAELIKPQKPAAPAEPAPAPAPAPARPKQQAVAAAKAPKPPQQPVPAEKANSAVSAKPVPPTKLPSPLRSLSTGSSDSTKAALFSRSGSSKETSTAAAKEEAARETLQQLRGSAAAACASLGASSGAARLASGLAGSSGGVSSSRSGSQKTRFAPTTGHAARSIGSGPAVRSSAASSTAADLSSSNDWPTLPGAAPQQRERPLQERQPSASHDAMPTPEPPAWGQFASAQPAAEDEDRDADIRAAIAASLAEHSAYSGVLAQQAAATSAAAAGSSGERFVSGSEHASSWPAAAVPAMAVPAAIELPAAEQAWEQPGSPDSDDLDYASVAAALRRQQELLQQQWRQQGTQQVWAQPEPQPEQPPTPAPSGQPLAGTEEDLREQPWQPAEPVPPPVSQLLPEQQAEAHWAVWDAAQPAQHLQHSSDDAEVEALLGLLGIPA